MAHSNLDPAGGFQDPAPTTPPVAASITLTTVDVMGILAAAMQGRGTPYVEPIDKPWGQTVAYLRDLNGILIELATRMG